MVKRVSAPVRKSVAVVGMAFFAALALLTNSLLWLNATTLRGTVSAADYRAIPLEWKLLELTTRWGLSRIFRRTAST